MATRPPSWAIHQVPFDAWQQTKNLFSDFYKNYVDNFAREYLVNQRQTALSAENYKQAAIEKLDSLQELMEFMREEYRSAPNLPENDPHEERLRDLDQIFLLMRAFIVSSRVHQGFAQLHNL